MLTFVANVKTVSEANQREHWRVKHKRSKKQKAVVGKMLKVLMIQKGITDVEDYFSLPIVVKMVRLGKRKLDDDNLAGAFKGCRDSIASELGIDDGSDKIRWIYAQSKGDYSIRVSIS